MLTGYQCEVVAFQTDGEYICRDCAVKQWSTVRVEKIERGLDCGDVSPIIRYTLDEINSERVYEAASERLLEFVNDHPSFSFRLVENARINTRGELWSASWTADGYRVLDKVSSKLEDVYSECCGECGEKLD